VKALDEDYSDTVTEKSEDDEVRHVLGNPIYSTKMDKEMDQQSGSNYESDEFEDEDPDDDFNLPSGHEQNNEIYDY